MDLMSTEHATHNHPGQTLDDAWRWDALETIQPESPPIDPDLAVQLDLLDPHDLGFSRGMRFRLAEMRAELEDLVEACGYTVSPCGIHLYPVPVRCCSRCGA